MSTQPPNMGSSIAPRHAALVAGLFYLLNTTPLAEYLYSQIVVPGNIAQTAINFATQKLTVALALLAYFANLAGDVLIAWALYFMLAPVSRSMSLLAAWFQLAYSVIAFSATMQLLNVWSLVNNPKLHALFDQSQLHAQIALFLHSFRDGWSMSLSLFGIHLVLVGWLIARSTYVPKWIGIVLIVNGLGWFVGAWGSYFLPDVDLDFVSVTYFGEVVFMLWLLIKGRRITILSPEAGLAPLLT